MKPTPEYMKEELHKQKIGTLKLVNGFLSIGIFHYTAWLIYQLITWIT